MKIIIMLLILVLLNVVLVIAETNLNEVMCTGNPAINPCVGKMAGSYIPPYNPLGGNCICAPVVVGSTDCVCVQTCWEWAESGPIGADEILFVHVTEACPPCHPGPDVFQLIASLQSQDFLDKVLNQQTAQYDDKCCLYKGDCTAEIPEFSFNISFAAIISVVVISIALFMFFKRRN